MADATVVVTGALVRSGDGRQAATIDLVDVGGGTQVVMMDNVPTERVHPGSTRFHVRLLSPDRMIPDVLREVDDYEAAVALGLRYAAKLDEHAARVDALAADLEV